MGIHFYIALLLWVLLPARCLGFCTLYGEVLRF